MTGGERWFAGAVMEITKQVTFEAAHRLGGPGEPAEHGRLHGHSFVLEATLRGAPDRRTAYVADLSALSAALGEVARELDHAYLNDLPGLERPTLERLCAWAAGRLAPRFATLARVRVARPSLGEACVLEVPSVDGR
ncbi:MAG: 6-carboxytetrahydropterin synthase [Caulobacterales bacterium]|nr:6-carboxytetrahydropterin synthase [Caulobacterales bacterium]